MRGGISRECVGILTRGIFPRVRLKPREIYDVVVRSPPRSNLNQSLFLKFRQVLANFSNAARYPLRYALVRWVARSVTGMPKQAIEHQRFNWGEAESLPNTMHATPALQRCVGVSGTIPPLRAVIHAIGPTAVRTPEPRPAAADRRARQAASGSTMRASSHEFRSRPKYNTRFP